MIYCIILSVVSNESYLAQRVLLTLEVERTRIQMLIHVVMKTQALLNWSICLKFHTKSHLTDPTLDIGLVTLTYLVSTRLFLLAVDLIISMEFLVCGFSGSKSLLLDQWMYQMSIYGSTNPQVTHSDQEHNSKDP